jgi:hypothetical protein
MTHPEDITDKTDMNLFSVVWVQTTKSSLWDRHLRWKFNRKISPFPASITDNVVLPVHDIHPEDDNCNFFFKFWKECNKLLGSNPKADHILFLHILYYHRYDYEVLLPFGMWSYVEVNRRFGRKRSN